MLRFSLQNTVVCMQIRTFNQFIAESKDDDLTNLAAGVAVIYDNKILLVHPTGASWKRGTCGIPKGSMKEDEDPVESALRELAEETGIILTPDQLEKSPHTVELYSKSRNTVRRLTYFLCKINDLSEIGLETERVPKSQLQLEEVDWAKFVTAEEAYPLITQAQLIILDRHLTLSANK